MARSRDKAAEQMAYEAAVEAASKGEQVNLKAIRVETRREQQEFQRRVSEKQRGAQNREAVQEGKLTLAYAGQPTRTGSDILRGAVSSRNLSQQPASVQKYVRTAQLNSDYNQGRIGAEEYKRRLAELNQTLAEKRQQEQMMRDRTSAKQAQSAAIKEREARETASSQGVALGTINNNQANAVINSTEFKNQKVSDFVESQKNLMSQASQQIESQKPSYEYTLKLKDTIGVEDGGTVTKESAQPRNASVTQPQDKIIGVTGPLTNLQLLVERQGTVIKQKGETEGPQKPNELIRSTDKLTDFFDMKTGNFFGDVTLGIGQELFSGFTSAVNLEKKGSFLAYEALLNKRDTEFSRIRTSKPQGDRVRIGTPKEIRTSETIASAGLLPIGEGIVETVSTGKADPLVKSFNRSIQEGYALVQTQGIGKTIGQGIGFMLPVGEEPLKVVPIGIKSFKALSETGGEITVRSLDVGYGASAKTVLVKTPEGFSVGGVENALSKIKLGEIEAVDRGLELSTTGSLGTKILTSQKAQEILISAGKMTESGALDIRDTARIAEIIKFSSKKVPDSIRQKAKTLPDKPTTSIFRGKESDVLKEELLPSSPPIKGTLAETVQLETSLVRTPEETREILKKMGKNQDVPSAGIEQARRKATVEDIVRSETTEDIDIDFGQLPFGTFRAKRFGDKAVKTLETVSAENRKFFKQGTNVFSQTRGEEPKELFNILTKRDAKGGYLNPISKPFEIKLKKRIVKVPGTEGGKKAKFVSIEQNAMNRIESFLSLQGPKTEKFKGAREDIPYLIGEQPKTPKGYYVGATEFRYKDPSKLFSQDTPQIARNLREAGYPKEAAELERLTENIKSRNPQIEFKKFDYPPEFGTVSYPSYLSTGLSKSKSAVAPAIVQTGRQAGTGRTAEPEREATESVKIPTPLKRPSVSASIGRPSSSTSVLKSISRPSSGIIMSRPSVGSVTSRPSAGIKPSRSSRGITRGSISKPASIGRGSAGKAPSSAISRGPSTAPPSTGSTGSVPSLGSPGVPGSPGLSGARGAAASSGIAGARRTPPILAPRTPRGFIPFITTRDRTKKEKGFDDRSYNFLGSTRVASIESFRTRKSDITVGDKKTEKLYRQTLEEDKRKSRAKSKSQLKNIMGSRQKVSLF